MPDAPPARPSADRPAPPAAATAPPDPAVASPWWQALLRKVARNFALCTGVALFITVLSNDPFWHTLVFSVCIGGSIQLLIEAGRVGFTRWLRRRGATLPSLRDNWPGWKLMGPWVLFSALAGYGIGMTLGALLLAVPLQLAHSSNLRALFLVLSITLAVSVTATYYLYTRSRMATLQAQQEAAQRLAAEHQLMLLQSQLEPHMLFNTLANLKVLIGLDTARAQAMLDRLIAYLRATLAASRSPSHALSAEFERLDDYLALMAVRMGPRLQFRLDLPDALRGLPVPPLLLQPLVENSIQHGLEPQVAGGRIAVSAALEGQLLVLQVRDTGVGLPHDHHRPAPALASTGAQPPAVHGAGGNASHASARGFGTSQVRQRLQVLYGGAAQFTLQPATDAEGGTLARITLPLTQP